MKVTLFGGAFDPPHRAHLQIAETLLQQQLADEVWFVPVKYHAFNKDLTAESHRVAMLKLLIKNQMRIEEFELQQTSTNFTYKTLTALSSKHPDTTFSFVIGSDNLAQFHKWDNFEQMVEAYTFYVYPRYGFPLEPLQKNMVILKNVEEVKISSTLIKEHIKNKQPIAHLVPKEIEQYISSQGLYQE